MSEPIKTAVIGCGYWGKNLVRNFAELGALAAVVDPDPAIARAQGDLHNVPARPLDDVLADPSIGAVAIAAPAHLHRDLTSRAVAAGKHVFVEKPIALSMEDGEAMRDEAAAAGVQLMVGHLLQYHPIYRHLRKLVEEGAIGPLRYVYSNRMSMGKLRTEEDVIWSFAPHDVSMVLGLTGESPDTITAHGATMVSGELADSGHLHMVFPSGLKAHIFTTWLSPFKEQKLVVVGEKGSLVFDDTRPWEEKLIRTGHAVVPGPALQKGDVEPIAVEQAEPLKEECRHFLESAAANSAPRTNADEALAVLDVLMRASKSLDQDGAKT